MKCPCGLPAAYADCCGRYHAGIPAPTPEALMRSRYSAFALKQLEYLRQSWDPRHCPADLALDDQCQWLRLEILACGPLPQEPWVEFRASFREGRRFGRLQERSWFVLPQDRWLYQQGQPQLIWFKPGRNEPCPCGSGRKHKQCCG